MADPLSIVAGVVGIIGFGVQVAQILQKEIDEITTATERVEQIVIEIRATATGLTNLKEFLLEDANANDNQVFNDEGRLEVTHIVRHCNTVFRNITVLVAKTGSGVLSQVDLYQRKVEEEHKKRKPTEDIDIDIKLEIELSNLEHLMWPWRLPKIQQYLADMDRLKLSLVLMLSVANLAKTRRQKTVEAIKAGTSDTGLDEWEGSDAETLVQDEIFYQDQGLKEAEQKLKSLAIGPSASHPTTRSKQNAAKLLIQSWPNSPSGRGLCSITELHDSGVVLESHAFNFDNPDEMTIEMPLNFQTLQQHALRRRRWGSKKPSNVWDDFAGLPIYRQEAILQFISKRKRSLYGRDRTASSQNSQFVLLSVYRRDFRWRRLSEAIKRFFTLDVSGTWGRYILFIVIARVASYPDHGENIWDSDSQESGSSYDSTYYSSDSSDRRRSRSRYRRRRAHYRSRSRSLSPGERHSIAGTFARKVKRGAREVLQRTANDQRRSRSQSRRIARTRASHASYADEGTDYDDDYGDDQGYSYYENPHRERSRRAEYGAGTGPPSPPEPYLPEPYSPRPPQRTQTNKTTTSDGDVPNLLRVETLNENDNEPSPSSRRATQDDKARNEPVIELPPPRRRTTTFKPDAEEIPDRSKGVASNTRTVAKTRTGTGRLSEAPEPGITRLAPHAAEVEVEVGAVAETEAEVAEFEMPIVRTFEDDGIPPTQRDKAAVAEYYLRKWTTAYDYARRETLSRPNQSQSKPLEPSKSRFRSRSRSRTRHRESYTRNAPGLIEYGDVPLYGDTDATAGGSDFYYPSTTDFSPPPGAGQGGRPYYEQKQLDDAYGKGKDAEDEGHRSDTREGDPPLGTRKSSANLDMKSHDQSRFQEVGEQDEARVEKDNDELKTLWIPRTDQRAYAESVLDLENEGRNEEARKATHGP